MSRRMLSEEPAIQALKNAPIDDEPVTAEDRAAIDEAERDVAAGNVIPHDVVCAHWRGTGAQGICEGCGQRFDLSALADDVGPMLLCDACLDAVDAELEDVLLGGDPP